MNIVIKRLPTESNNQQLLLFRKVKAIARASLFRVCQGQKEKLSPIKSLANSLGQDVAKWALLKTKMAYTPFG